MKESHPYSKNPLLDEILKPRRMAFIVNPKAGTRLQNSLSKNLDLHLNHRLFEYKTFFTERAGHATEEKEPRAWGTGLWVGVCGGV